MQYAQGIRGLLDTNYVQSRETTTDCCNGFATIDKDALCCTNGSSLYLGANYSKISRRREGALIWCACFQARLAGGGKLEFSSEDVNHVLQ